MEFNNIHQELYFITLQPIEFTELDNISTKIKREEENGEKTAPKQKKDDSIFAVFKKSPPKPKKADNVIVCDKSNTFIKRGRLCECTLFQPEKEKKEERSFNFSDWKKIKFS